MFESKVVVFSKLLLGRSLVISITKDTYMDILLYYHARGSDQPDKAGSLRM